MDDYNRGSHSKYRMKAHLIFMTKYRKKIFEFDTRADDIKQFLYDATQTYGYKIVQMETENTCLNNIGNTKHFGQMDIWFVA